MKLYELVGADKEKAFSPFVWRAKMALRHKGQEYETIPLHFTDIKNDLAFADAKTVPVLVDGDNIIKDSWDIACYLEDNFPDKPSLFGGDGGRIHSELMVWQVGKSLMFPLFKTLVFDIYDVIHEKDKDYFRKTREPRIGCTIEQAKGDQLKSLAAFQENLWPYQYFLKKYDFLGGNNPLFSDYILYGIFQWARGVSDLNTVPEEGPLSLWLERMDELYT